MITKMTRADRESLVERGKKLGLRYISHPGFGEPNRWVFPDHVARGDFQARLYIEDLERKAAPVEHSDI